jgi:hypothetical protein
LVGSTVCSEDKMLTTAHYTALLVNARRGAKRRGFAFELSDSDFYEMVNRANGTCMLTGIPFSFQRFPGSVRRPYAPSLDRINSATGYTSKNVRLVCLVVNFAMNQWGFEPLKRIAENLTGGVVVPVVHEVPHYRHTHKNVTYMTMADYLDERGIELRGNQARGIIQRLDTYCRHRNITIINVRANTEGINPLWYLGFPVDVLPVIDEWL